MDQTVAERNIKNSKILRIWVQKWEKSDRQVCTNNFVDDFQQQQAALALQFLINPQVHFPEYELPLNKILCGLDLHQAIESKLLVNEAIKSQAQQLLEATIKNWPALKNTSAEGLAYNFLQREGKLTRKSNGDWKLHIEYQTQDILLSKLNWNYSMVKLPWMNNMLWVDWG